MTPGDWTFTLKSGRKLYSCCNVIGLNPNEPYGVFQGFDGELEEHRTDVGADQWTLEECQEVAEAMIQAWVRWLEHQRAQRSRVAG